MSFAEPMILVCYLVAPGEVYARRAKEFLFSYSAHRPGMSHDLLLVCKDGTALPPVVWCSRAYSTRVAIHPNQGWDIASFLQVCAHYADYPQVMWLGSNCRILHDGWLAKFYEHARHPTTGAVGATGSWEAGITGVRPNPHLRTSVLMAKPTLINSLGFGGIDTRTDCYEFEHGHRSLTNRLKERNLTSLVVGVDGEAYEPGRWPESRTFRTGAQDNLLVADKMTDMFAAAEPREREVLAAMAGWSP